MPADDHFARASQKPMQIPMQQPSAGLRTGSQFDQSDTTKKPVFIESFEKTGGEKMVDEGFEPPTSAV